MKKNIKNDPLISVIICTYNTKEITMECLDRLYESIRDLEKSVEVILIDNGSDGTGQKAKEKFPSIILITPGTNTGFARGNNLGLKKCNKNSKYILLLNSDAFIKTNTLNSSVFFMERNNKCDVLGCKLVFEDGRLQYSAGFLPNPISAITWICGIDLIPIVNKFLKSVHPNFAEFYDKEKKVGWVMGAYFFARREVFEKVKGFDERIFMYMEEVEMCKRISEAGLEIWYTPSFSIKHLDKSSSKNDPEKVKKIFTSDIVGVSYYINKFYPRSASIVTTIIKLGLIARIFAFTVLGNKLRSDAYADALKLI